MAAACGGGRTVEQQGTEGPDSNNTETGPTDDETANSKRTEQAGICADGYDVEYVGPLVDDVGNGVAVALAPQGVYVLSYERAKMAATLRLFDANGELLETTSSRTVCGRLFDLEWQDGKLYVLGAECDWNVSQRAVLLWFEDGNLVLGPTLGDDVVAIASGNEGELFVLKNGGIGRLSLKESGYPEIAVDPELPSPPAWGPTSDLAHVDGHFMFSRDAFEVGMTNQIMIVGGDRSCSANVELFLPGVPGIKIAADSERLMLLGGELESFAWSTR
jgi:hypothetical protein